jgi:hypothetical protein
MKQKVLALCQMLRCTEEARMVRALTASWQRLLMSAIAAAAVLYLAPWPSTADVTESSLPPSCAAWDRAASVGVALLVPNSSALAEAQLDFALYQLRRARRNCRAGRIELAREDYAVVQSSHPFPRQQESRRELPDDAARQRASP